MQEVQGFQLSPCSIAVELFVNIGHIAYLMISISPMLHNLPDCHAKSRVDNHIIIYVGMILFDVFEKEYMKCMGGFEYLSGLHNVQERYVK